MYHTTVIQEARKWTELTGPKWFQSEQPIKINTITHPTGNYKEYAKMYNIQETKLTTKDEMASISDDIMKYMDNKLYSKHCF
jgi:hypothetical protein